MTSAATYRIAHYGTGDTGSQALRGIIARPEFELVAHLVHSPDKVGTGFRGDRRRRAGRGARHRFARRVPLDRRRLRRVLRDRHGS